MTEEQKKQAKLDLQMETIRALTEHDVETFQVTKKGSRLATALAIPTTCKQVMELIQAVDPKAK